MRTRHLFKKRSIAFLLFAMLCFMQQLNAQNNEIRGIVVDNRNEPVAGVSIECRPKNSNGRVLTTTTNENGAFNIPGAGNGERYDLIFSHISYEKHTVSDLLISRGKDNALLVKMQATDNSLDEVIVTSLGITKEKKR